MKGTLVLLLIPLIFAAGCDSLSGLFNPFDGTWKSSLFTLKLNPDKTFEMQTVIGITIESGGEYKYDDQYLYLNFSGNHTNEFTYEFNEDKSKLSLSPKTESRWFKATITFEKES